MESPKGIKEDEEDKIKELLLFRKIIKVDEDCLYLDNGVTLHIVANEGCGCGAGMYSIVDLNTCDNVITNVELTVEEIGTELDEGSGYSYKIFVYAEDNKIKVLQVDGEDGNGYYGVGYEIFVIPNNLESEE